MSQHTAVFEINYAPLSLTTEHIRELFEDETHNGVTSIAETLCKQVRRINGKKHTVKYKKFTVIAICKRFMFNDEDEYGRIIRYHTYLDSTGEFACQTKLRILAKHY
jgi:hypothetical protein